MALNDEDFMTIEELGDKWPYDWVSTKGLAPYVKRLGENVTGIEIGTCRAESTAFLLENCPNVKTLYTIDPFMAYDDWVGTIDQTTIDKFFEIAQKNLAPYGDRVRMIRETSKDAVKQFDENLIIDFIFIDGDHSYESTLADCETYYPLLKKGGLFCGHDYSSIPDVSRAVNDFRQRKKISSPINLSLNSAFFWYK